MVLDQEELLGRELRITGKDITFIAAHSWTNWNVNKCKNVTGNKIVKDNWFYRFFTNIQQ